jgi:hypothetical protein
LPLFRCDLNRELQAKIKQLAPVREAFDAPVSLPPTTNV